jgi:hypothetical protein
MKSGGGMSLELVDLSGGEAFVRINCDVLFRSILAIKSKKVDPTQRVCPFGVSSTNITHVASMHSMLEELLKSMMLKVSHLKGEKAKLFKKLIGIKFNMEYLKSIVLEAQDSVTNVECKLQVLSCEMELLEQKVCGFWVLGFHLFLTCQISFYYFTSVS